MHDQTLEQAAREAVIILGDTQNLTAHGPGQPAAEQGGGLDDLQRHPPASAILWLCNHLVKHNVPLVKRFLFTVWNVLCVPGSWFQGDVL